MLSGFSGATFGRGKRGTTWSRGNGVLLEIIMYFVTPITRVLTSLVVRQQHVEFFEKFSYGNCGILYNNNTNNNRLFILTDAVRFHDIVVIDDNIFCRN